MATSSVMTNTFGPAIVNTGGFSAVSSATNIQLTAGGASTVAVTNTTTGGGAAIDVFLPLAEAGIEGKIYKISNALTSGALATKTVLVKSFGGATTYATLKIAQAPGATSTANANTVTLGCYYTGSAYDWAQLEVGFTNPVP